MKRVWFSCLLALASASAAAEPAQTDQALQTEVAAEQQLARLAGQRAQLAAKYQAETDAIDRLKKEKASWRRDRELRASLADSNDTATQLAQISAQLVTVSTQVAKTRAAAIAAIDAELAAGSPRAARLGQLRAQLAPPPAPKKLVIPDAEIDPLADPDELEQQAAALRAVESELGRQEQGLDDQAKELKTVADIRKEHERAGDLMLRDDGPAQRAQPTAARTPGGNDTLGTPPQQTGAGGGSGAGTGGDHFGTNGGAQPSAFESEATVVLGDVIDHQAIEGMLRASRSGDPAQRADAAQRARDAVHARIEQLEKKRAAIEARAKTLRGGRR